MSGGATQAAVPASHGSAPIRGTQSLVGVMGMVWKRPTLTGLELLWRWVVGIPTLALCAWEALHISHTLTINMTALHAITVFKPVEATATLAAAARALAPAVVPVLLWLVPLAVLLRTGAAAIGRGAVLRRLDPRVRPRRGVLFALSVLRAVALLVVLAVWIEEILWANRYAITGPASRGADPNVVLLWALVVSGALVLFMLWASSNWVMDAAMVVAVERNSGVLASMGGALHSGRLPAKLVEINLVMGIVKVCLIVLAMVFSSCPLPFGNVSSPTFLAWWWTIVIALYCVASDYFQAVRLAAYQALYRAYQPKD